MADGPKIAAAWLPDPWGQAPFRWWDGEQWSSRLSTVSTGRPPRNGLKRGLLLAVGVGVPLLMLAAFMLAPRFGDDTWRAKVISVEGRQVCTKPDKGEKDPGWVVPFCLADGAVTESGEPVPVRAGQCIEIESKHPAFYVKRVVPCA